MRDVPEARHALAPLRTRLQPETAAGNGSGRRGEQAADTATPVARVTGPAL